MATTVVNVTNGNYTHKLIITLVSQNIAANTSSISYTYTIHRNVSAGSGAFAGSPGRTFTATINGSLDSETKTFDFTTTADLTAVSGTKTITHNSDGTKSFSASIHGPTTFVSAGFPETTGSGTMTLPTIPRASTSSFDISGTPITSVDAGTAITIDTNRADGSFTHDLSYTFGALTDVSIATGVGASQSWTPPLSMLAQIPSATSGTVVVKTITYSGATVIGTTTTNLTLTAGSAIVPDFGTVTVSEHTTSPNVSSIVGGYVKGISTLSLAITSPAGIQGSTITGYKITVAGQTFLTQTATTAAIAASGTVAIVGTVTDSRGRTHSETVNVTVLDYANPVITQDLIQRATSGGTVDANGTYLKITLTAAVTSLIVSTQKNDLHYQVKTRDRGDATPWSSISPDVGPVDAAALSFNSTILHGTYPVTDAFDVRIEVFDALGTTSSVEGVLGTGGVLMHWSNTDDAVGVGKYWEQGSVDAADVMYQDNGKLVLDEDDLATLVASITAAVVPTGVVSWTAARTAPTGYLLCDGAAVSRTTYATLFSALNPSLGTVTMTIANPAVVTLTSHNMQTGQAVYLTTTGALPTGLTANTAYYVIRTGANTFNLATSLANALAGTTITTTGSQSGTHTLRITYGVGNGSSTFNVPNLKGKGLVGVDTGQTEFAALGETGGEKTHTLVQAEVPNTGTVLSTVTSLRVDPGAGSFARMITNTAAAGGDGTHNNLQPYLVLNGIIKT